MMVRRDLKGVTHWANAPTSPLYEPGGMRSNAFCNPNIGTYGTQEDVPQEGPTCLWCLAVMKMQS